MSSLMRNDGPPPVAVRLREAARLLGVCERTLWAMVKAGEVPCRALRHGTKTLYLFSVDELRRWAAGERVTASAAQPTGTAQSLGPQPEAGR